MACDAGHVPEEYLGDDDKLIRKLRKKLRQIERLELLNRAFSEEEREKVLSKTSIRQQLLSLLSQIKSHDESSSVLNSSHNSKCDGSHLNSSEGSYASSVHNNCSGDGEDLLERESEKGTLDEISEQVSLNEFVTTEQQEGSGEISENKKDEIVRKGTCASKTNLGKETSGIRTKKGQLPAADVSQGKNHLEKTLISSFVQVTTLDSHCDIVTSVVIHEDTLVSGSRDTTVKCWNIETGKEIRSLGSHTESVTCLTVLSSSDCLNAFPDNDDMPDEPVIVSGSWDCTLKLWGMHSGKLLSSIYTFNPVTQVSFFPQAGRLITGSDGGKLELWNISDKSNVFSTRAYDASVSGIKVEKDTLVYSCAANGVIQVHSGSENGKLKCLFVSDDLKSPLGKPYNLSHIRCVELWNGKLLVGQHTSNIKLVDWKKGIVEKLRNHQSHFSFTDAICCHDDTVITSGYDLDKGYGSINVRRGPELKYCGTLDDEETERILCMDFSCKTGGQMIVVTGGMELKMWKIFPRSHPKPRSQENATVIGVKLYPSLSEPAVDSESDDDNEKWDDDDDEEDCNEIVREDSLAKNRDQRKLGLDGANDGGSWLSWCSLL